MLPRAPMGPTNPRLLVGLPNSPGLEPSIAKALPGVPWALWKQQSASELSDVEAILVASIERGLSGWTSAMTPRLRFVQRIYTGLDGFAFDRIPPEVRVAGNVGGYAPFVAEHAVALVLALAKSLPAASDRVLHGQLRPAPETRMLLGGTALVLGFGEIGRAVGQRLRSFGMRIEGVSRTGENRPDADRMYDAGRLFEALHSADVVVEARPLTRRTAGSIDRVALEACKATAIFVNVGRAGTIDEAALYEHLERHPEFRVGLDVWWDEDYEKGVLGDGDRFAKLPNFLGTPHSAAVGPVVRDYALERALENLGRYFRTGEPAYLADRMEYVDRAPGS